MDGMAAPTAERDWDVILIGAGQNSFALGTYLGMAGLETVICESRLENGGRLASEEITLPGYWHNTLAYFQDNRELSPVWRELGWEDTHHAAFVRPPVISALLLEDGRALSYHQVLEGTVESIARFSARDAAAWRAAHRRFSRLVRETLIPYYYRSPLSSDLEQQLERDPDAGDFQRLWRMTPRQVVDELFEDDAVKTLILSQMAIPRGVAPDYAGAGIEVLKLIAGDEKPELARGGSHSIAQVLQRAYVRHGGQIRAMHHVERILVDGNRAVGVRLRDGREWRARLAVVSSVDPYSTFIEMIGEEHLPKSFVERVKDIRGDEFSCFEVHLALKAPVRYALHEAVDPAVAQAMSVSLGPRSPEDLEAMWREIRAGEIPRHLCLHAICPTLFDPLQAPPGKHTASVFVPVPFQVNGKDPEDWVKLKTECMERVLAFWRRYATSLTEGNIESKVALDPFYLSGRWRHMRRGSVWVARKTADQMGRNRPIEELAGYRTPVRGLYHVGVAFHPADAVIAGSGRNAWEVMKEDLGLALADAPALGPGRTG
ncbi:MAG TPA: NAD(P)/FAD-dependent oxidoreductase [candidate division Zixibacteria bacterium]|nr:NAD(P)/FAD-dependent oxidoreductase [candidate division Zixibacteria bacterium]